MRIFRLAIKILILASVLMVLRFVLMQIPQIYAPAAGLMTIVIVSFLLVLLAGIALATILFFSWKGGEESKKEAGSKGGTEPIGFSKKPLIVIIVAVLVITLGVITGSKFAGTTLDLNNEFPITIWLVFAGAVLLYGAGKEFYSAVKSDKPEVKRVTLDMITVALGLTTLVILYLEAFVPGWWKNVWGPREGIFLILALITASIVFYRMPGTGTPFIKVGKFLITLAVIATVFVLIGKAIDPDIPSSLKVKSAPQAREYAPASAPVPAPAQAAVVPKKKEAWEEKLLFPQGSWNKEQYGWVKIAKLPAGTYEIILSGRYTQEFDRDNGTKKYIAVGPEGLSRDGMGNIWVSPEHERFIVPNLPVGYVLGRMDGTVVPIGRRGIVRIKEEDYLYLSINADENDETHYLGNTGGFEVNIKKMG